MGREGPTLIERLAAFGLGVRHTEMAPEDVNAIRWLVLDTLGCALGAIGCAPARLLERRTPLARSDEAAATRIGDGARLRLGDAVLCNGALVRYLDFMDVYWARDVCHPSENIPVALAAAEASAATGRAAIEAIAAAYEIQVRLADAFSFEEIGLHHASAAGFVAPLIYSKLEGLGPRETAQAMALGGHRHLVSGALVRGHLSMAKAVGYAYAAASSLESTRLAADGFTGPLATLEDMGARDVDLTPGTSSVRRVSLKQFPVQFSLQAPIEAALRLRQALGADMASVERLVIQMPAQALRRTADAGKFDPQSRETADHSLPCCVAMALAEGSLRAQDFDAGRWRDADVRSIMSRTRCEPFDDSPDAPRGDRAVRLVAWSGGRPLQQVVIDTPLGDARRPMGEEQVLGKFLALAEPTLGQAQARQVADLVFELDALTDVGTLCRLLGRASRRD